MVDMESQLGMRLLRPPRGRSRALLVRRARQASRVASMVQLVSMADSFSQMASSPCAVRSEEWRVRVRGCERVRVGVRGCERVKQRRQVGSGNQV
jgi:hypothetical protein